MKKNASFFKQAQALVLTVAMLMSVLSPFASLKVFAETNKTETLTEGKIVAQNYDLSSAEKDLIGSGLLAGGSHTYLVPDSDDGLITVDTDNKKITVGNYEGTTGYLWKAVSVNIVVGTEIKETVSITNGEGNYTYEGNAFSVVAEYALDVNIAKETQSLLLNTPKYLTEGLANLKDVAAVKDYLGIIELAMPQIVELAGDGIEITTALGTGKVAFDQEDADSSALCLQQQMIANGGDKNLTDGKLDLSVMISEYEASASKVQYLAENGAKMKAAAEELAGHIDNILLGKFWSWIGVLDKTEYLAIHTLHSALTNASTDLKAVCAKDWDAAEKELVKDGLTALEYSALDTLVAQLTTLTDISAIEIKNPLRASTARIQHNMSMFDVTVKVALNLTDASSEDIKYYEYASKSTTVTLAEGATKAEILAAVLETGIEADAKASWGSSFVDGKFTATTSELPDALTKDIDYVITYNPNMYDVTFGYGELGTVSYPYGYVVKLESHANAEKAYDYTINGSYYAQGSSYMIVDATSISRKEGKSYVSSNLYQIVADNYLDGKGASILTSGAVLGNQLVAVRYPDNSNGIVTLTGNKLSAADYNASYNGLSWKPYSYTLSNGNTYLFNGANEVDINELFDNVTVNYRLYLTNYSNNTVIDIANLPDVLNDEAKEQLAALNAISSDNMKNNLETLNNTMVGILAGLIENTVLNDDAAKDAALKASFGSVLDSIKANCMGSTNLYLYDIVNEYRASSDKLLYYYNNNDYIRNEIAKMAGYMTQMLGEDASLSAQDKLGALETLIRSLPSNIVSPDKVDEYVSKLTTLESTMSSVKADLSAPNAAIDLNSDKLGTLTKALQSTGNTQSFASLNYGLHLEDSTIVVVASDKTAVTVTLNIEGGKNVTVTSDAVFVDAVIDDTFVNTLKNNIKAQLAAQSINAKYYNTTYDETIFDALVGKVAGELEKKSYEFTWTYKTFEVSVPGTENQPVSLKDRGITLPASTNAEYRYDYYINGIKVSAGSYTLSDAEFDKVIEGAFLVTRQEVYILRENLVNYVNSLNESVASDLAVFALVENNGSFSIVLKIDASAPNALTSAVQGIATGMVQGSYPYVGVNNDKFLEDGSVYLQTLVDALLDSGFGSDTMLNIVDANGNIKNMPALEGNVVTNKPLTAMGGKLMQTTMQLGISESDATSLPFYVTLGAVGSEFVQVRNLFEEKLSSFLTFACDDGKVGVSLNMPEKMYEAFLAVLLVTENISLNDINAVNGEIAVTFVNNLLIPLFKGDITVETFDNTLAKFGQNFNLSSQPGADALFSTLKSFYTNATFTYDETSGTATGNIGISSFIDSMNVGVLGNIIAEKETGIDIAVGIALEDLGKEYEAIYVDVDAAGITNKVGLTADLSKKLGEVAGTSAIVLLKDIEKDLTFNKTTLFNLNGFNVKGDLTANAKTIVIDSYIKDDKTATVDGKVSGNITLVAGKYTEDVSAYVKNGFAQGADGVVANQYYDISKDSEGNVVVSVNAGLINTDKKPDITGLAIDLACDLLFNGYSSNYLELDGNKIYDITLKDLVGLYGSSNRIDTVIDEAMGMVDSAQLSAFVNTVLDDAMDFAAIAQAIENDAPVFEYSMVTKPWDIELVHVKDGNYITSNVISGDETHAAKLKICVVGEDEDKTLLADLFKELGETVTSDINVTVSHSKDGTNIKISAAADANVMVDWTDPNYAVMFSVIIADGLSANERADLVNAIRGYYENGDINALSLAFNSLKTSQVISAIKNFAVNDSFADMVKALKLDDVVKAEVNELEALYDRVGKVAAFAVRKAELVGGNRTLGSFLDSDGSYGMTRANIERLYSKELFRGYAVDVDIAITNAVVKIKLFDTNVTELDLTELNAQIAIAEGLDKDDYTADSWAKVADALAKAIEARKATTQKAVDAAATALKDAIATLKLKAPVFVDGHGNAEVLKNDKIAGAVVNHDKNMITLDAHNDGITVAELKELLKLQALNADSIELVFGDGTLADSARVANGTKVTATARRNGTDEIDVVTHTIIVLGDINGNGRIEAGDAVEISQMLVGEKTLSDTQLLAADTNCNGRTDIGDATRIASKYVDWNNYETMLGNANM
ncbi:MAG: hypothetical protein E7539_01770 [Ruminococcaceae bacterium]|nr:hypothetical protein [Oscillospiraceae bacterium]